MDGFAQTHGGRVETVRRARGNLNHVAKGKLGLVERRRVHASGSLATLVPADVRKRTPPRSSRTPDRLKDLPSPDRLLPMPRPCPAHAPHVPRSGKDCAKIACRTSDRTTPVNAIRNQCGHPL